MEEKKNILVLYSNTNTHGKQDATGAFIPEAKEFARVHDVPNDQVIGIKLPRVPKVKRRERTIAAFKSAKELFNAIVFFGHGWAQGIQFGFNRKHIPDLVRIMKHYCTADVKVILFACLAAENDVRDSEIKNIGPGTDGGFADVLRDEMSRQGFGYGHVDAHKTAGHTSWNPFLVRFLCEDTNDPEFDVQGGAWIVQPRSELWKRWVRALRDKKGGLRYRFPFMTEMEIKNELASI